MVSTLHYENKPLQYTEKNLVVKMNFSMEIFVYFFLIFAQNIDCGYRCRGGSNLYPQSIFWRKNRKNRYTCTLHTPILLYKSGVQGGTHFTFLPTISLRRVELSVGICWNERQSPCYSLGVRWPWLIMTSA